MILKTKVMWRREKELDPKVKEGIKAKSEFIQDYDPSEDLYEEVERDAILDTDNHHLYVQVSEDKCAIKQLFSAEFIDSEIGLHKFEQFHEFKAKLSTIYNKLNEQQEQK